MLPEETRQLCQLFATVFDYPRDSLAEATAECIRRLEHSFPKSAERLRAFLNFVQSQSPAALEELYTYAFDLSQATTPYVGYHLFGESPKRSALMTKLQEAYQSHHFSPGTELPDHLCVILRFLNVAQDAEFVASLLQEGLLPMLGKMERSLPKDHDGYAPAVSSLRLLLQEVNHSLKNDDLKKTGGLSHG